MAAGKVAVIAPARFMEEAASENIMAGAAMGRRASYQFGAGLIPGAQGQMTSGIGPALSAGTTTLIAPTDTIAKTGETRTTLSAAGVHRAGRLGRVRSEAKPKQSVLA